MKVCPSCATDNVEAARFCMSCGQVLGVAGDATVRSIRKTVTIVFCDLTGSTTLGERLDPESLREVLTRYFTEMEQVVVRHGGVVEKFIGDAVLAVFGIPVLHEDDALRGVRAAAEMREAIEHLNDELQPAWGVRIGTHTGVNTGEVVVGDPAAGQRLATGDAVNTAARLEQAAGEGEVLIGELTHRLVRGYVDVEPMEPLELKGKAERVKAFRLVAVREGAVGSERPRSPMVGRDMERSALHHALERSRRERTCHLVTVLGAGGVGKSRLVADVLAEAPAVRALHGRCQPYGEGVTFSPLREVVHEAAGVGAADPPEEARAKLESLTAGMPNGAEVAAELAAALGLSATAGRHDAGWAFRRLLEGLAVDRPVVVALDDLQWAEPTFLDAVEHVADTSRGRPLVLLCMARDELLEARPTWGGGKRNATSIFLEPLDGEGTGELLAALLGPGVSTALKDRIAGAAEGNPRFVEETVAMLIDRGSLRPTADGCEQTGDAGDVPVPDSITALVAARLDRLGAAERRVLAAAAVIGRSFDRPGLEAVLEPEDRDELDRQLEALARKDLLQPGGDPGAVAATDEDGWSFRFVLIRDAAYESLSKRDRARLHERFGRWIDPDGSAGEGRGEVSAMHLERAVRWQAELGPPSEGGRELARTAAERLGAAGRRALDRRDVSAATSFLQRAVALVGPEDVLRAELLPSLAEAQVESGEIEQARATVEEAQRVGASSGDPRIQAHATLAALQLDTEVHPEVWASRADRQAAEAIELFQRFGDHAGLARVHGLLAEVRLLEGRSADCADAARRAMEHAGAAGLHAGRYLPALVLSMAFGPVPVEEAEATFRRYLEMPDLGRNEEAATLRSLAAVLAMRGGFEEARELAVRSGEIWADLGRRMAAIMGPAEMLGHIELLAGDPVAAEAAMRPGYEALDRLGERAFLSTLAAMLADALLRQGRGTEAFRLSEVAEGAAATDDAISQVMWRAARGRALAATGDTGAGEALVREAVDRAERTDQLTMQGDVLLDLAEVLASAGRTEEARASAVAAEERYIAKGAVAAASRAARFGA